MEYEIKLSGTPFDDGAIDLDRLELLAQYLQDIAKGSLQMRMFGTSVKRGRNTENIANALKIRLRALSEGSTVLHLECQPFRETLSNVQGNLFQQEILQRLPNQTPIALVMESFQDALNPESSGEMLDKQLLKSMLNFKKVFINEFQVLQFSNKGSLSDLKLNTQDFSKLKQIEDKIPKPQLVVISGMVEELKFSKAKVTFIPDKGKPFTGFLGEAVAPSEMATLWGKKATIRGIAHFKPNGLMAYVEIAKVTLASSDDDFFSHTPTRETVEQQLERQLKAKKGQKNHLSNYIGTFADAGGSFEQDLKMLKE